MQTYSSALDLASASDELRVAAQGYMGVAVSLYDAGELDAAIQNYRRALELFERIEDRSFELSVLHSLASIHFERGATADAKGLHSARSRSRRWPATSASRRPRRSSSRASHLRTAAPRTPSNSPSRRRRRSRWTAFSARTRSA